MSSSVSIRLDLGGEAEVKAKHESLGQSGQQAFGGIATAADRASVATDQATGAIDRQAARYARLAAAAQAVQEVERRQANLAAAQQVHLSGKSAADSAAVFQAAAAAEEDLARRTTALKAAIDPAGVSQAKFNTAIAEANTLFAAGKITTAEHAAATRLAQQALAGLEGATRGAGAGARFSTLQMQELGAVVHRTIDSVAAGAPPMRILATEGARLGVAFGSGPSGVAGVFSLLTSPIALVIGGILAVGGAVAGLIGLEQKAEGQEARLALAIRGSGAAAGVSVGDLQRLAAQQAKAGDITTSAARDIELALIGVGQVSKAQLPAATAVVEHYAAVMREELPAAAEELAKAFANPAKGAVDLNDRLHFLTAAELDQIRTLEEHGDKAAALDLLLKHLSATVGDATEHMNFLARAAHNVHIFYDEASDSIGNFLRRLADVNSTDPGVALKEAEDRLKSLQALHDNQPQVQAEIAKQQQRIAAASAQIRQDQARAAQAQASEASDRVKAAFVALNPQAAQIAQKLGAIQQLKAALADPKALAALGRSPSEVSAAIVEGEKEIKQLRERAQMHDRHAESLAREAASQDASARAGLAVAAAYLQDDAAGERAEARRKALTDATRKGIDVEGQVRRQLALVVADQAAQGAKQAAQLSDQADVQARLNGQVSAGLTSADEANRLLHVEGALRPLVIAQSLAEGEAKARLGEVIARLRDDYQRLAGAQAAAQLLNGAQSSADRAAQLRLEAQYADDVTGARERLLAVLQVEQSAAFEATTDERAQAVAEISAIAAAQAATDARRAQFAASTRRSQANSIELGQKELQLIGATDAEREHQLAQLARIQALKAEGIALDSDDARAILAQGAALDEVNARIRVANDNWNELKSAGDKFIDDVLNPQNWTSWRDVGKSAILDIAGELVKLGALNPLKNFLFGESNPTLGGVGSVFSRVFGGFHLPTPADAGGPFNEGGFGLPGFASGTDYAPGGFAWVGENGPELERVGAGARITPADATRRLISQAANDAGGTVVHMPVHIDARGAGPREVDALRQRLDQLQASLPGTIVATVNDAAQRRMIR